MKIKLFISIILALLIGNATAQSQAVLLKNVTVIDGSGKSAQNNMNVLLEHGKIKSISTQSSSPMRRLLIYRERP